MTTSEAEPSRPIYKNPWLIAFVVGAVTLTVLGPMQRLFLTAPPPLAEVGTWSLTDQRGQAFGSKQLEGKVWVADYFFTRCPSICPKLTAKMKTVEERFKKYGEDVHFVSFSVDPEFDKPEQLRAYAEKNKIDLSRWTFVTGELDDVKELLTKRMFMHVGEKQPLPPPDDDDGQEVLFDIAHMGNFALFDQRGDLRGTFSTDLEGLGALGNATRLLVERGPDA